MFASYIGFETSLRLRQTLKTFVHISLPMFNIKKYVVTDLKMYIYGNRCINDFLVWLSTDKEILLFGNSTQLTLGLQEYKILYI